MSDALLPRDADLLARAAASMADVLIVLSAAGDILAANDAASQLLGAPAADVLGQPLTALAALDDQPALRAWLLAALAAARATPDAAAAAAYQPVELARAYAESGQPLAVYEYRLAPIPHTDGVALHARDVTQHDVTARALQASEARFRGVMEAGLDAFVIVQAVRDADQRIVDFTIVDVNARAATMAEPDQRPVQGRSLLTAFPKSRHWKLWEQCCAVVITRQPLETTQHAPITDQSQRWLQRVLVPMDADMVAIASRDITPRELARRELQASEARHRQLFENNGAIQLLADAETAQILDVNPAAEAFYGWTRATMQSMYVTDFESSTLDQWRDSIAGVATGSGQRVLREHRVAGGGVRTVEAFIGVVAIDGRRALHVIIQDLSDRMMAERQLRESEAKFRAVIASMREGVVVHDHTGAISVHNPSAERILGLSADQLRGLVPMHRDWQATTEDGSAWPADRHPAMMALRDGVSQSRALMGVQRGDGTFAWLSVTADPLVRPGSATPYAAVAVFTDITEARLSEDRLRQAQKLEAVAQLAGGIAHDFNNLLTVVRGASGFLRESIDVASPMVEDLDAIDRATVRAEELTRRLLAVGRRQMLRASSVDLNALLRDQLPVIRDDVPRTIAVRLDLTSEVAAAAVDRAPLLDALRTLVDNAKSAMPQGGTLTIGTKVAFVTPPSGGDVPSPRRYVVLRVSDTGIGMDEEVRAHLFEPFFSTQPFGTNKGMGLASVHGMVHQHRGFVECDSAPDAGTTLRLYFPEAVTAAPGATTVKAPPERTDQRAILLVDDDPMLLSLARRMLEKSGHVVIAVDSAAQALALLASRRREVAALLTDLTMPEMGGLELLVAVEAQYPDLPRLAMSGFTVDPEARAELDARQVPFIAKPFAASDLQNALGRVLSPG